MSLSKLIIKMVKKVKVAKPDNAKPQPVDVHKFRKVLESVEEVRLDA